MLKSDINTSMAWLFLVFQIGIFGCNQANKAHILRVSLVADPILLHPIAYNNRDAEQILSLIYQKLSYTDALTGESVLDLAIAEPIIQDIGAGMLTVTYSLDPKAVFSDQTMLVSTDVAFSALAQKNKQINPFSWKDFESIVKVETPDKHHIRFFVSGQTPDVAKNICNGFFIVSQKQYDPESRYLANDWTIVIQNLANNRFGADQATQQIIGSGKYTLNEWKAGKHLVLKLNETKNTNKILNIDKIANEIRFFVLSDKFKTAKALRHQKIDVQTNIDPDIFRAMQQNKTFTEQFYLIRQPCLQAVLLHINRQKINKKDACLISNILSNTAWPGLLSAVSVITPIINPEIFAWNYKPKQVGAAAAIVSNMDTKLPALRVLYRADNPAHAQLSGIICARLSKIGFKIIPWPISPQELKATLSGSDFELFLADLTLFAANHDYRPLLGLGDNNNLNYSNYSTDKTDSLTTVMAWSDKKTNLIQTAKSLEKQILTDPPHILLGFKRIDIAISKRFKLPLALQPYRPNVEITRLNFK